MNNELHPPVNIMDHPMMSLTGLYNIILQVDVRKGNKLYYKDVIEGKGALEIRMYDKELTIFVYPFKEEDYFFEYGMDLSKLREDPSSPSAPHDPYEYRVNLDKCKIFHSAFLAAKQVLRAINKLY